MDTLKHRIGYTSLFFSTIYNKAYYVVSSLTIALLMEFITTVEIGISHTLSYWLVFIIYFVNMFILYVLCRKHKKKHNKLDIRQLNASYIALRIFIMLLYSMIATVIVSIIHVWILLLILK